MLSGFNGTSRRADAQYFYFYEILIADTRPIMKAELIFGRQHTLGLRARALRESRASHRRCVPRFPSRHFRSVGV